MNATYVELTWDPMDEDEDGINGLLAGYEIHYWRTDDKENVTIKEIKIEPGELCRDFEEPCIRGDTCSRRAKRQTNEERLAIVDLWPYTSVSAAILVKNIGNA